MKYFHSLFADSFSLKLKYEIICNQFLKITNCQINSNKLKSDWGQVNTFHSDIYLIFTNIIYLFTSKYYVYFCEWIGHCITLIIFLPMLLMKLISNRLYPRYFEIWSKIIFISNIQYHAWRRYRFLKDYLV